MNGKRRRVLLVKKVGDIQQTRDETYDVRNQVPIVVHLSFVMMVIMQSISIPILFVPRIVPWRDRKMLRNQDLW
jgi:hypothetical protein